MKFRPCIDLHAGQVKQIVGSTLTDEARSSSKGQQQPATKRSGGGNDGDDRRKPQDEEPATNFATDRPASEYASMYQRDGLTGGHVIMLGPGNVDAAKSALAAYPGGLQIGGGINSSNAKEWLDAGASHVIVTSFVFHDGQIDSDRLNGLLNVAGKERLVLDLSCRRKPNDPTGPYYVVTDRWQTYTDVALNAETLSALGQRCDEFLVHGVENEGKRCGILEDLVVLLGKHSPVPVTYAGGVRSIDDMDRVKELGGGKVDLTIGSALDCFGGDVSYDDVVAWHKRENAAA